MVTKKLKELRSKAEPYPPKWRAELGLLKVLLMLNRQPSIRYQNLRMRRSLVKLSGVLESVTKLVTGTATKVA